MKLRYFGAAALVAASSTAAMAGNLEMPAPEPVIYSAPAPVFTPGYDFTGFYGGASLGFGQGELDTAGDTEGEGAIGGLFAGYDRDFGNYVMGIELDLNAADIDLGNAGSIDQVHRLKLRAGYDGGGRTLVYGTGGVAYAKADVSGTDFEDNGWVLGAGVEHALRDNVTIGGEVLYHQFDDFDDTGIDADATTVQARVTFRF
ncbi:porin family protein [Palleronia sediminis]|uniref:Porin family protein n=1 Tax=Palleronia sediminis TaxID=2547833 RepID=A0A4R6AMF9_9RHOB|nr:outer membrane beta-barrel protein [Palleronia sediminis]TDL83718.1 porin family protein [Palleronia sediminis]